MSKKVKGEKENNGGVPFILTIFKLCKKYHIEDSMIRTLAYNDLLYLIVDSQRDEIKQYLNSQKKNKKEEIVEIDESETYAFLVGNRKGSENNGS